MYEKILNYFETNLCMENIYFRKNYKKWIIGLVLTLLFELASNYALSILISNIWVRSVIIILFDFIITILFLVFIYIIPLKKIYRKQVNTETKIDRIGLLMKEESLSAYREIEIKQMEKSERISYYTQMLRAEKITPNHMRKLEGLIERRQKNETMHRM